MYFDCRYFQNEIFSLKDKKKHVCVTIFVLFLFLKMATTGLFPGHRAVIVTAVLGFCKPVKATTSVSGFPGFIFESFPLPGGLLNRVKPLYPL